MQFAYSPHHTTETSLPRECDIVLLCILDERKTDILMLLDLSAAFDTIGHGIMLRRLGDIFGITRTTLKWFELYFTNRRQKGQWILYCRETTYSARISCTATHGDTASRHGVNIRMHADDPRSRLCTRGDRTFSHAASQHRASGTICLLPWVS